MKPSMHGVYLLNDTSLIALCVRASRETSKPKRQEMVRQIFTGYNASSDFPGMAFADDLIEMYPNMKIVLNKRKSASAWAKSANDNLLFFSTWKYALCCGLIPICYWHWYMYRNYAALAKRRFGRDIDTWSEKYYDLHNAWIREVAKNYGRKVLEWEPSMGWEPLCDFLEVAVPEEEFPSVNDANEIKVLRSYLIKRGITAWCFALGILGGVGYVIHWWLS
jgi:hypothetical protein